MREQFYTVIDRATPGSYPHRDVGTGKAWRSGIPQLWHSEHFAELERDALKAHGYDVEVIPVDVRELVRSDTMGDAPEHQP